MSRINFRLCCAEHEKSFITLGPDPMGETEHVIALHVDKHDFKICGSGLLEKMN